MTSELHKSFTDTSDAEIEVILANRICAVYPRWDATRARKVAALFCQAAREDVGQFKFTYVQHAAHAVKWKRVNELITLKPQALGQIMAFASGSPIESTEPYKD